MTAEKLILDATAGFRMMWFNKHHPNTLYLDKRPECEPDVLGDFRNLKDVADETFRLIIFDPPHLVKQNHVHNMNMVRRFGYLQPETWQRDLQQAFTELWRVLKPYGVLLFKWNNFSIDSTEIIKLAPAKPLVYQVVSHAQRKISKQDRSRSMRTLWFCFMKIPEKGASPE